MKNKKGISGVIETVLLILVVIAAVGIISGLVLPMIRTAAERTTICQGLIEINSATASSVTYTQTKDANVTGVNIIVTDTSGLSNTTTGTKTTGVGTSQTVISFPTGIGTVSKVGVMPVISVTGGKKVTCPVIESTV